MTNLIDNKTKEMIKQYGSDGEHYGEPLTWPITKKLIGRKVRFDGYVTGDHKHWSFVVGEEYLITNVRGTIGPVNIRGCALPENFENDFKFILLPERETPVGYYYSDEENKLKPLRSESSVLYNAADVALKIPASEKVELPQHHQTGENVKTPAMPIEFSGFGQFAPEAHEGLTKREMFAVYAMQGILSNHNGIKPSPSRTAEISVNYADALLAELEKQENNQ